MTDVTFRSYDAANYLRDETDIEAFFQAAAEDGDPVAIAGALGAIARARSMIQLARDAGLTREALSETLQPNGSPALATLARVADALGFELRLEARTVT